MFNSSLYLFRFKHSQIEIPYTNIMINIFPPWTYIISFGSCLLYMFLITVIFPIVTAKLSLKWRYSFEKIHYTLLFLYSFFACFSTLFHLIKSQEITNWLDYLCTPVPPWLRIVSLTFTLSKIWEWVDTAVLISKGHSLTKIGFLHIYHHATTFLLFLYTSNLPGAEKNGMLLNGFVHTVMYYHFAFRLPKLLRPIITTLQITQLIAVTYMSYVIPIVCSEYKYFPSQNMLEYYLPGAFVPVYCLFFFKFFIEQYLTLPFKKIKSSSRKEE
jgi:hypothetical protein